MTPKITTEAEQYSDEEAERRAAEMIRSSRVPHKLLKEFTGKTDRAKQMARAKKLREDPKS